MPMCSLRQDEIIHIQYREYHHVVYEIVNDVCKRRTSYVKTSETYRDPQFEKSMS